MKITSPLILVLFLTSCSSIMTKHRMKAADRKLSSCQAMQAEGQWQESRIMAEKMRSSVTKSVADKPVRTSKAGNEVDLQPLLTAWEKGPLQELRRALDARDSTRSTKAFTALRQQCATCHLVLGRDDIKITEWPKS